MILLETARDYWRLLKITDYFSSKLLAWLNLNCCTHNCVHEKVASTYQADSHGFKSWSRGH